MTDFHPSRFRSSTGLPTISLTLTLPTEAAIWMVSATEELLCPKVCLCHSTESLTRTWVSPVRQFKSVALRGCPAPKSILPPGTHLKSSSNQSSLDAHPLIDPPS